MFNSPPLKKIKEELCFILNKKNSSIEDKFDILLSTFEHKINRKLVRKNSKNMFMSINQGCISFGGYENTIIAFRETPSIFAIINDNIYKYFEDCKIQPLNKSTDEINKQKFDYFASISPEKIITNIIKYISELYYINFVSFSHFNRNCSYQVYDVYDKFKISNKSLEISNINYNILFNVQLDKKPITRKIFFATDYTFKFDIDKTYSIIDESTFGHLLIEEY